MPNPAGTTVKPVRGMLDGAEFVGIDHGRSVSSQAQSGVAVSFTTPFNSIPRIAFAAHEDENHWIDPDSVSTSGFTWYAENNNAGIDWIAIGT